MIRRFLCTAALIGAASSLAGAAEPVSPTLGPDRLYDARSMLAEVAAQDPEPSLEPPKTSSNTRLAILYSLLLPGLGEYALGHHDRAKVFFVAEGAIWTSYAVFQIQGSHRKDLYKEFADVNAGVSPRDDDDFYRTIGNYIASDGPFSANEQVRREARANYPDSRADQEEYFEENAYTGNDAWAWESEAALEAYQDMRDASESAYHKSEFSLGLAIANRLISVVDTGILAAKKRKQEAAQQSGLRWNIEADPAGARLLVSRSF
ncbi:MAG TPA: hypothetical protein VFP10_00175 [Candidatus Eisenbacteria bacterium]|nr:hypothetical protein [Candidatus Eisenbacteria bacterium]